MPGAVCPVVVNSEKNISNREHTDPEPQRLVLEMAELVGGLAHELRNPLSTMMINLKLLAEDLQDRHTHPEDARRRALLKVENLRHEAERLQSLFDEFLTLTGPSSLKPREVDINDILSLLAAFYEPQAKAHRISLELCLGEGPLICNVDERLLRQALLNIVINAQQAMPDGGDLRLATSAQRDMVAITFSDTGVGIAPEDRKRIARPFFSTKVEGVGLGLSITQRIIHEHDGSLSFESELGRGTTFTVLLPRSAGSSGGDRSPG